MSQVAFSVTGRQVLLAFAFGALLPVLAIAQAGADLATLLRDTHVHGLSFDPADSGRLLIATHHGLHALDLASRTTTPVGDSQDDFMGFTTPPTATGPLYASGHPAGGGNLGVIASEDGGQSWAPLSEGVGGPVDFHQMEVSRANAQVLYGSYAGAIQTSCDGAAAGPLPGPRPRASSISLPRRAMRTRSLPPQRRECCAALTVGRHGHRRIRHLRRSALSMSGRTGRCWPSCSGLVWCGPTSRRLTGRFSAMVSATATCCIWPEIRRFRCGSTP